MFQQTRVQNSDLVLLGSNQGPEARLKLLKLRN